MSTTFKPLYRANPSITITITIASLGNGSTNASSAIDNTTDLDVDKKIGGYFKTGTGTSGTGTVEIRPVASADAGTSYAVNSQDLQNVPPIVLAANADSTTYEIPVTSLLAYFGGLLPSKIKILFTNKSGSTLDSTGGNHAMFYEGIQEQGA